jgi:hypothetical protein
MPGRDLIFAMHAGLDNIISVGDEGKSPSPRSFEARPRT